MNSLGSSIALEFTLSIASFIFDRPMEMRSVGLLLLGVEVVGEEGCAAFVVVVVVVNDIG